MLVKDKGKSMFSSAKDSRNKGEILLPLCINSGPFHQLIDQLLSPTLSSHHKVADPRGSGLAWEGLGRTTGVARAVQQGNLLQAQSSSRATVSQGQFPHSRVCNHRTSKALITGPYEIVEY